MRHALVVLLVLVVAPAALAAAPAPAPAIAFTGLDSTQIDGANPADVQIAVGPGGIVEAVNSSAAVYALTAGAPQLRGTLSLGQLFSGGGIDRSSDDTTDPRIVYDPGTGRFLSAMFDIRRQETDVAVSLTPDPVGARAVAAIGSRGCPDQPRLGFSSVVVVLTDDVFSTCQGRGRFVGGDIVVLLKEDLLAGRSPRVARFGPSAQYGAITPALTTSPTDYLVTVADGGASIGVIRVDSADVTQLPVATVGLARPLRGPGEAPQRGSRVAIDAGDDRVQNAFFQDGTLWLTAADRCPGSGRSCARVIGIDPAGPTVLVDRTLALPSSRWLLYPAIAPDSRGNVVVAFEYSSAADYPSLAWTYMRPDGSFGAPADAFRGTAPNDSERFGDYSGAASDPLTPSRVWIAGEIGAAVTGSRLDWSTGIAAVTVPPQPPAVLLRRAVARTRAATITASVYPEGAATSVHVEVGPTTRYGTRGAVRRIAGTARVQALALPVAGLRGGRTYHFRVVATSARGTVRSADRALRIPG